MSEDSPEPLIDQLVDGIAAPDAWDELAHRMRDDEELAQQYIAAMQMESLLSASFADAAELTASELRLAQHAPATKPATSNTRSFAGVVSRVVHYWRNPTPLSYTIATLVVGLLIGGMAMIFPPAIERFRAPPSAPVVVARLTEVRAAVWGAGQVGTHTGSHLVAGHRLQLQSGIVKIAYRSGTIVALEGPCDYLVADSNRGELDRGRLLAQVPPAAVGFCVNTPTAAVVDLGTEFGVAVSATGAAEVVVLEGKVECRPVQQEGSRAAVQLAKGQSAVFNQNGIATTRSAVEAREALAPWNRLKMETSAPTASALLIAQWKFDGDLRDAVGVCHGVPHGDVGFDLGRLGQAASFDGDGDFVTMASNPLPATNFTMAAWVYPRTTAGGQYIAGTQIKGSQGAFLRLTNQSVFVNLLPPGETRKATGGTVPAAAWSHLAMTVSDEQGLKVYVNGSEVAADREATSHVPVSNFTVAVRPDLPLLYFDGLIDDLAVWNRPLTPEELAQAMNEGARNFDRSASPPAKNKD